MQFIKIQILCSVPAVIHNQIRLTCCNRRKCPASLSRLSFHRCRIGTQIIHGRICSCPYPFFTCHVHVQFFCIHRLLKNFCQVFHRCQLFLLFFLCHRTPQNIIQIFCLLLRIIRLFLLFFLYLLCYILHNQVCLAVNSYRFHRRPGGNSRRNHQCCCQCERKPSLCMFLHMFLLFTDLLIIL